MIRFALRRTVAETAHYKLLLAMKPHSPPTPPSGDLPSGRYRSKTWATWLAALGGSLGLHRFYLRGWGDLWGWLHPFPTVLGLLGVLRMRAFGQDDRLSWLLIPILGLMITQGMLHAIVYGLKSDEAWDRQRNPGLAPRRTGWGPIFGVILALMVGATILMGTVAFGGQKFFEWQTEREGAATAQQPTPAPAQTNTASPT
jgi:hypothetical protein